MIRWRPWMSWRTGTPPDGSHWLPGISSWWMADHPGQRELLELTRELASQQLRPVAAAAEHDGRFPRQLFRMLGRSGLLGLPWLEGFKSSLEYFRNINSSDMVSRLKLAILQLK